MRLKRPRLAALASAVLLTAAGCGMPGSTPDPAVGRATAVPASPAASGTPSSIPSPTGGLGTGASATPQPIVLAISVDGFNPSSLRELGADRTPGFQRLVRQGASTLDARTSYEETHTLPNHTGMMTGLPVGGTRGHGTTMNEDDGRTLEQQTGRYVPGIFDVAHDAGLRTAMYVGKDKFRFLIRSWDGEHGAPDTTGADDGRDKVDTEEISPSAELIDDVIGEVTGPDPAALTFLHLPLTDTVGHKDGFMSQRYLSAVQTVDGFVSDVLAAVDRTPGLERRITVIVTADHGGRGPDHDDEASPDNYTIPFFVWGRGVARGQDLYALNPGRRDPGTGRPGYDEPQPVRNMDVADLSLRLLGLRNLPNTLVPGQQVLRVR